MLEPMTVRTELLVLAADEAGIWLVNGTEGAWLSDVIMADSDMHWETQMMLLEHGVPVDSAVVLHSTSATAPNVAWTSWHPQHTSAVHTYIAIAVPAAYVRDEWPGAEPVTAELAEAEGPPAAHGAAEAPVPRHLDVAFHALGHIRWLMENNDSVIKNMEQAGAYALWRAHLAPLRPFLARMYYEPDQSVA